MKIIPIAIVTILITACTQFSSRQSKVLEANIGWMHGNCLAIRNQRVTPPYAFTLVRLDNGKHFEKAVVTKRVSTGESCYPLLDDRVTVNKDNGYTFYLVKSESPVNLGIGVLEGLEMSNLDFDFCNTTEGIRFSVSDSRSVIWEGYYYLGYESKPTCIDGSAE